MEHRVGARDALRAAMMAVHERLDARFLAQQRALLDKLE
jgi:hypothetical protein